MERTAFFLIPLKLMKESRPRWAEKGVKRMLLGKKKSRSDGVSGGK